MRSRLVCSAHAHYYDGSIRTVDSKPREKRTFTKHYVIFDIVWICMALYCGKTAPSLYQY